MRNSEQCIALQLLRANKSDNSDLNTTSYNQGPRRLLKQVVKTKLIAMYIKYIMYATECGYTTGEVITTALYCKHWINPGRAERVKSLHIVSAMVRIRIRAFIFII